MIACIWNIRGFGSLDRKRHIKNYVREEGVDIIGLQETVMQDLSREELDSLTGGVKFDWHWLAARGLSGGIMLGMKEENFEVLGKEYGEYYVSMTLKQSSDGICWECIVVYGSSNHAFLELFLRDLDAKLCKTVLSVMIAGDFNMIRCV
jgi:exonuclease III